MADKATLLKQLDTMQSIRLVNILWIWTAVIVVSMCTGIFHLKVQIQKPTILDRFLLISISLTSLYGGLKLHHKDIVDEQKEEKIRSMIGNK